MLVLDAPGEGLRDDEPFEVVVPAALFPPDQQRELRRMTAIYNVMELATALKPFLLRHLLAAGAPSVTYLDPDIEVFAPLDDVAGAAERHGIVLTPHRLTPVPADGRQPDERAFLVSGAYNLGFVAVGPAGAGFLDWWADRCGRDCLHDVPDGLFVDQRWVDVAAAYFPPLVLRDPGLNVAYWNVDERPIEATPGGGHRAGGAPLRFLHYSGYDPDAGHQLTRYHEGRPRVLLSEDPALHALCAAYGERLRAEGWDECRKLDYGLAFAANGMVLDGLMRRIVRQELLRRERTLEHDAGDVDAVPDPYEPGEVDAFVALLRSPFPGSAAPRISRYLHALHHSRPDLQSACPHLTGPSGNHFLAWIRSIGQRDLGLPPEVIPAADEIEGDVGAPAERPAGVRLVGYLDAELGMGELGRGLLSALRAAGEPVVTATETVTLSRRRHDAGVRDGEDDAEDADDADVNVVCVNADRLPMVMDRLGTAFTNDRYTIGVWAWEVEEFPGHFRGSGGLVDEVWTCSAHARDAIAAGVDVPVHRVPPPVLPRPSVPRPRHELGLPDGFTFLFCFDFFSVVDRKNPFGVIDAFCRAFAPGEGPHLLIKSINGAAALADLERVRLHAAERDDVHVVDGYVSAVEQAALVAACDAYVSLHRAEGFGYTMAEAMLAGRPVVATGYSGNLEFMDDRNSVLVGYDLVPIGEGKDPYPAGSRWADPDLDEAAAAMRRLVDDPAGAAALGERGRQDILRFHSAAARAPLVAARLASARSARADLLAARAAALAPGSAWVRAGRLGRAGVREAVARRPSPGAGGSVRARARPRPLARRGGGPGSPELGDEHDHREHQRAREGGDVEHLVGRVVQVEVAQVVHEVGQRVEDPGHRRGQHRRAGQGHECDDRHRGQGEVQRPEVAHEVLVVRAVDRHPPATAAREVVVERPGGNRRPQPQREGDEHEHGEGDADDPGCHAGTVPGVATQQIEPSPGAEDAVDGVVDEGRRLVEGAVPRQDAGRRRRDHGEEEGGLELGMDVRRHRAVVLGAADLVGDEVDEALGHLPGPPQGGIGHLRRVERVVQQHRPAALVVGGQELAGDGGHDRAGRGGAVHGGQHALGDAGAHRLERLAVRLAQQLGLGAEVVLHEAHGHAGLGGHLTERDRAQTAPLGDAPERPHDLAPALLVVDPLGHAVS